MPIYQFVVRSGDHEDDPDVRWSHLPDKGAARRYGHLLIKDLKSSGRYPNSSLLYVVVKDEMGNPLISIINRFGTLSDPGLTMLVERSGPACVTATVCPTLAGHCEQRRVPPLSGKRGSQDRGGRSV